MLKYNEYILESKNKKILPEIIKITKSGNNSKLINFLKNNPTNINDTDDIGNTALILACDENLIYIVDTLIKNNADVNLSNSAGYTPLMLADTEKIIDMLLNVNNIDINKTTIYDDSALTKSYNNSIKIEKLLNQKNIDVNIQNIWGKTAIMNYIDNQIPEINILEKMLDKGLNLNLKNKDGNNLYDMLKEHIERKNDSQYIEKYLIFEKYINERFPEIKNEWEFKNKIKKYNL
ncbi:ankyrin repeat domain-containing protein [Candidatus Dojkabacteria bacterium]|jgi:ankyrin repeat protein|nr:ankyrin repeat domain-containing protein [Candidatus Dojkabacteria bacterium]